MNGYGYVLVHVHEGTLISAYGFDTLDEAEAFKAKFSGTDEDNNWRDWNDVPELPSGYRDDPDSDTWVLVEGIRITYVEGDEPFDARKEAASAAVPATG